MTGVARQKSRRYFGYMCLSWEVALESVSRRSESEERKEMSISRTTLPE